MKNFKVINETEAQRNEFLELCKQKCIKINILDDEKNLILCFINEDGLNNFYSVSQFLESKIEHVTHEKAMETLNELKDGIKLSVKKFDIVLMRNEPHESWMCGVFNGVESLNFSVNDRLYNYITKFNKSNLNKCKNIKCFYKVHKNKLMYDKVK